MKSFLLLSLCFLVGFFFACNALGQTESSENESLEGQIAPVLDFESRLPSPGQAGKGTRLNVPQIQTETCGGSLSLSAGERTPAYNVGAKATIGVGRQSPVRSKSVTWNSSGFVHRSLLFEQPLVERDGLTRSELRQNIISGVHFFGKGALLPGKLLLGHHHRPYRTPGPR